MGLLILPQAISVQAAFPLQHELKQHKICNKFSYIQHTMYYNHQEQEMCYHWDVFHHQQHMEL